MRSRKEILDGVRMQYAYYPLEAARLEVLLDIRDILQKKDEK